MSHITAGLGVRLLAAVTALAWLIQIAFVDLANAALLAGFVPVRLTGPLPELDLVPVALTPLTATLVHGDILHLTMNLITFWYCGKVVERFLGTSGLALLYFVGAYASAGFHLMVNLGAVQPMVGASGAISAVVGAYAMLFSTSQARALGPIPAEWVRALWLAATWTGVQWMIGFAGDASGYSIAIAAHMGGFFAGLLLAKPLLRRRFG